MALKMLYRGPSSRLETLIEKIQQTKELPPDIYSSQTSSSFSPSISDGKATPTSLHSYDATNDHDHHPHSNGLLIDRHQEKLLLKASLRKERDIKEKAKNVDGSYQCPFCDKSFPRLGYLKKHEQSHVEHMPFKCDYCQRLFKHKRSRDRHTKLHTGDRRYKCPHCEAAFSRSDHLKIHMKTHDNQKPFQCTICNRGYNTAAALTSHMQNHKKQVALTGSPNLTYSPRSISSNSSVASLSHKRKYGNSLDPNFNHKPSFDYINYARSPSTGVLSCIYCTKSDFSTIDQLHVHVQAMHGGLLRGDGMADMRYSPNIPVTCEFCTMKCPSLQILFHHLKTTHMDRIGSPNAYLEQFSRQMRSVSETKSPLAGEVVKTEARGETPKQNGKESVPPASVDNIKREKSDSEEQTTPTDLSQPRDKRMKLETTGENPKSGSAEPPKPPSQPDQFLCNQCNAALPDFESFRNHLRSHLDQPSTSFLCQHCAVSFTDPVEYERHVITHFLVTSSEFACTNTCNKAFGKPDDLQKHLFELHAVTLYKCSICAEVFDTKVAIKVHFAVAHSNEVKLFRCSACSDTFRSERDFRTHIRSRHMNPGAVQCVFCRVICSSELEMHFHLAAHARQFRCPACPESFHVEFLLDRHMETHHRENKSPVASNTNNNNNNVSSSNNNNNINLTNNNHLDYQHHLAKSASFYNYTSKFYSPAIDPLKHPSLLHGIYDSISKSQRYLDVNSNGTNGGKTSPSKQPALGMYGHAANLYAMDQQPAGFADRFPAKNPYFNNVLSKSATSAFNQPQTQQAVQPQATVAPKPRTFAESKGFSCGMCERQDFSTESEVHTHRKIVHNLKTGVSLRCAYCNGDYRSRSELENHMKIAHNTNGKHKCLICDEIFPSPAVLAEHKLTHCKVGPSGRCSHCFVAIPDQSAFKGHLFEHTGSGEVPTPCICCRQTLSSEFEISLHAKFHTKSTEFNTNTCALCLESLPAHAPPETKICESCLKKHNFAGKFLPPLNNFHPSSVPVRSEAHFGCNICKKTLPSGVKLQEHLIEHTFAGCEERGYNCYICSSVFTSSSGLLLHIQEHGAHSKPYDCNYCDQKFFFRAELDHHLVDHELYNVTEHDRRDREPTRSVSRPETTTPKADFVKAEKESSVSGSEKSMGFTEQVNVKLEGEEQIEADMDEEEEDEEYIEVEKIHEPTNGKVDETNEEVPAVDEKPEAASSATTDDQAKE